MRQSMESAYHPVSDAFIYSAFIEHLLRVRHVLGMRTQRCTGHPKCKWLCRYVFHLHPAQQQVLLCNFQCLPFFLFLPFNFAFAPTAPHLAALHSPQQRVL